MDDNHEEDEFLTESATLSLVASTEPNRKTINTTWVIIVEIVLLVSTRH